MSKAKHEFLKKVGDKIRQLRTKAELSQETLADRAEVHRNYLGRIERAESNPPILTIYRIAVALKVAPSELLSV